MEAEKLALEKNPSVSKTPFYWRRQAVINGNTNRETLGDIAKDEKRDGESHNRRTQSLQQRDTKR